MNAELERAALLLDESKLTKLKQSKVALFGLGGVGGHCAEALARAGIGKLHIVDADVVSVSNLNRQLIATRQSIGKPKADICKSRLNDISDCEVTAVKEFLLWDNVKRLVPDDTDYIVDAVDTVTAKLALACEAKARMIPIISCMGTGNRLDPTAFIVTDIYKTSGCPLAKVMRRELKARGIERLKVVYSTETPVKPNSNTRVPGSVSFVPGVAGMILAGEVVRDLLGIEREKHV